MSGKFLLIGVILQLAGAVWVAAGDCETGKFPVTNPDSSNTCVPCSDSAKGGIDYCAECSLLTSKVRSSTVLITCTKCSENVLSPLGDACLTDCPFGSYAEGGICKPCHESCANCNNNPGAAFCTACYPGFVLSHPNGPFGTCIPECTKEFGANCETCTAILGSSRYCSRCETGFVPVDGICVSATAKTSNGCTSKGDGTCSACTGTYFLESGGCYQSTAYPGKTLCETANDGKCILCANLQTPNTNGSCPLCAAGCDICDTPKTSTCWGCLPGYYLSGIKCVKCDSDDGSITGVKDCVSCAPPDNDQGSVTCYVIQPSVSPTDPSVNKGEPSLSASAIAGISIVIILIIGGLAGFLCWWFLCHKKK